MRKRMIMTLAQMAAFFADSEGGEINVLKLMKLLYLADRESMRRHGHSISNDDMFSLPHGPILSKAYRLANQEAAAAEQQIWREWFADRIQGDRALTLCTSVSREKLNYFSELDIEILQAVWNQFGKMNQWQLRDYTHTHCKEWCDPHGSRKPIEEIEVLRAIGIDEAEALLIAERIKDDKALCREYAEPA